MVPGLFEHFTPLQSPVRSRRIDFAFGQRPVVIPRAVDIPQSLPRIRGARVARAPHRRMNDLARRAARRGLCRHLNSCRSIGGPRDPVAIRSRAELQSGTAVPFHSDTWWSRTVWPARGNAVHCPSGPSSQQRVAGVQRGLEDVVQLCGQSGVFDLSQYFDPPIEVTVHHVGAAESRIRSMERKWMIL